MYGVTLQILLYILKTVAKSVLGTAGPTVDAAAGPIVDDAAFFPPGTVEAVLVFDPVDADAGPLLETGAGGDDLDMVCCIQVF